MFEPHCVDGSDTNRGFFLVFVFFMFTLDRYVFTTSHVLLKEVSISHAGVIVCHLELVSPGTVQEVECDLQRSLIACETLPLQPHLKMPPKASPDIVTAETDWGYHPGA